MYARIFLTGIAVSVFAAEASGQNGFRWRPGSILQGMADTVRDVSREISGPKGTPVPDTEIEPAMAPSHPHHATPTQHHHAPGLHHQPPLHRQHPTMVHGTRAVAQPDPRAKLAASIDDVIRLVDLGVGEKTITQYIAANGIKKRLSVDDLIRLHKEGVSENIIIAMQKARVFHVAKPAVVDPIDRPMSRKIELLPPPRAEVDLELGPSVLEQPTKFEKPALNQPIQ